MSPTIGSTLGGRYTLTERIATGGMGDVYAARDAILHRIVAVKVMRPRTQDETTFAMRFRDEARHTAKLAHPNIATVYDYGEDDGTAYLVMELVPGKPLSTLIEEGPLPQEQVRLILGQCALALASAHEAGVVHRDVKPANILVTPEGQVKLTDFGIARANDGAGHTRTGEVMGTPQYLAPEQAMGRPVTGASDLYALGVVGFEMLTGTRPFDEESAVATALAHINNPPPPLPAHVTDPVRSAIEACLAKDPDHRPASASSLAALLGMPVSGVGSASPAARVIPVTDLGMTQPFRVPTAQPTEVVPQAAATSVMGAGAAAAAAAAAAGAGAGGLAGAGAAGAGAPAYLPPATPPIGPGGYREDDEEDDDERGASGWWWLLPIAVALLVGTFFYLQSRNPAPTPTRPTQTVTVAPTTTSAAPTTTTSAPPTTTSAAPTTTTTGPRTVVLLESDYVGQQIGTVRQTLTALGLTKPIKVVEVADAAPKGTVLGVSPTGTIAADVTVTVTVSKGPAPTTSAPAPTTSAPAPTTAGG
jgi:tRNA A-37 threonylcarbamoyl transferase component Bud32